MVWEAVFAEAGREAIFLRSWQTVQRLHEVGCAEATLANVAELATLPNRGAMDGREDDYGRGSVRVIMQLTPAHEWMRPVKGIFDAHLLDMVRDHGSRRPFGGQLDRVRCLQNIGIVPQIDWLAERFPSSNHVVPDAISTPFELRLIRYRMRKVGSAMSRLLDNRRLRKRLRIPMLPSTVGMGFRSGSENVVVMAASPNKPMKSGRMES